MTDKLFYWAATQGGEFWKVDRGHTLDLNGEEFVVTGWDAEKRHVYVSRDTQHLVITSEATLWDQCNMQFRKSYVQTATDEPGQYLR